MDADKIYPACCSPSERPGLAERMYCAYNRGGDSKTAGLNYQGSPCPIWPDLPQNIRDKWTAAAKEAFEHVFSSDDGTLSGNTVHLSFGQAITALKFGMRVCREGWNGKGMWLELQPGVTCGGSVPAVSAYPVMDCIWMKTAQDTLQPGWLASQSDMLANDWMIVTP